VTTFTSCDAAAADRLALARLDDDGAPPPVTWPQAGDSHEGDAIRRCQPAPDVPAGAPAPDVPAGAPAPAE
jgi:hypothetical protein